MAKWLNWFFYSEKPAPALIKSDGEIHLEGDKAIYSAREGYRKTVIDLSKLQYIYVYTTENAQNLVLNDYSQHIINCTVTGFDIFFRYLSSQYLLDENQFLKILASRKPQKVELWRANNPDNCQILDFPENSTRIENQQSQGFWICSSPRQWISWDMTSQELADLPLVYQTTNEYGMSEIRFHFPVQIGNLVLDDLRYSFPGHLRLDVPLDDFYSYLRIKGNGDQNYFLAKEALGKTLGEVASEYKRDDQSTCQWVVDGIGFALIYWYDSRFSYESGYTYLNIKNQRTYPEYLTNADYELNIQLSKYLCIARSFSIGSDFRRSQYFQQTPRKVVSQLLVSSAQFIVWLDEFNGKAGFANAENAMIFPLEMLTGFQCQNVVPDRSNGGVYLSAIFKQGIQDSILIGDCHSFDPYIKQLEELIQLPVTESTTYE